MVILEMAAAGTAAQALFGYNRQNYKFDRTQQIRQEILRLRLQIKRFELFRQDIRDLVKLTVDRMNLYHLVGALCMQFIIVFLTKGRVQASAPPFLLSLFLLTNACAFIYLLLAVWMSMHASVASHSFGVRILTRFVRLPIPSKQQIDNLTFKFKDFEKHGVSELLRVPFLKKNGNEWKSPEEMQQEGDASPVGAEDATSLGPMTASAYLQTATEVKAAPADGTSSDAMPKARKVGRGSSSAMQLLPENFELPLYGSRGSMPDRHVQLFRELQAKWQCYDAYCRVSMALGVNQLLQVLSYWAICHTVVENNTPSTGFALVAMFQCATVAVAALDLSGLRVREIIAVQAVGIVPCVLTVISVAHGSRNNEGVLDPDESYLTSPLSFAFTVCWLELWLRVSAPTGKDKARLPRRFRQILFLDVFGDTKASGGEPTPGDFLDCLQEAAAESDVEDDMLTESSDASRRACNLLPLAQRAIRRWQAAPHWTLSAAQRLELRQLEDRLKRWTDALRSEVQRRYGAAARRPARLPAALEGPPVAWAHESEQERLEDPFAGTLLGPFNHDGVSACYYWDLEAETTLFEDDQERMRHGALVLELQAIQTMLQDFEYEVRGLLESRIMGDLRSERRRQRRRKKEQRMTNPLVRQTETAKTNFPNLIALLRHPPWRAEQVRYSRELAGTTDETRSSAVEPQGPEHAEQQNGPSSEQQEAADPTLTHVAGREARHFVPERLPWFLLMGMTRVLQGCWTFAAAMAILKEIDVYAVDFGITVYTEAAIESHGAGQARQLFCGRQPWSVEHVAVMWPHGRFFRAQGLHWQPCEQQQWQQLQQQPPHGGDEGRLLVSTRFGLHAVDSSTQEPWHLEEIRRERLPSMMVMLCSEPANAGVGCLLGTVLGERLVLRPLSSSACKSSNHTAATSNNTMANAALELPLPAAAQSWRVLAGAVLPCSSVSRLISQQLTSTAVAAGIVGKQCIVLVGWGGSALSASITPLVADRLPQRDSEGGTDTMPSMMVSLPTGSQKRNVAALHLDPRTKRLLVLASNGELEAWDIFGFRSLGRWWLSWPTDSITTFEPVALCEDPSHKLLILGRRDGLELLRAEQPSELPGDARRA